MLDSFQIDPATMFGPFMIMSLGLFTILWFAMLGGSLKFSVSLCSDSSPSYLRCVITAILMIAINGAVFAAVHSSMDEQPWYVTTLYQLILQSMLVAVLLKIQPIGACIASIAHAFFAGFGSFALALIFALCLFPAVRSASEREKDFAGPESVSEEHVNTLITPVSNKSESTSQRNDSPASPVMNQSGMHGNPFVK